MERQYSIESAWDEAGSIYYDDDDSIRKSIAEVFIKLSEDVRDYILEECLIVSAGGDLYGTVWPSDIMKNSSGNNRSWIIILSENMPEDDKVSIIAHEMAHAYLKHDKLSEIATAEVEIEACQLVMEWGFNGCGADIKVAYDPYKVTMKNLP